jgi:two-component system CheB/CheR fusion protein
VRIDAPITRIGGERREMQVEISVRPVHHDAWPGEMLLVLFDEAEVDPSLPVADAAAKDPAVVQLEQELLRRNAQLAATIEQYETSSEELKASNEELQAINEELRSATEELETSKEELQSTNEELTTVNHELKTRIEETTEVNDDLTNLISSSGIATVFVDASMRIKRFTPAAATLFNIIAADVGRSLFDITHKLVYDDMAADARSAFATLRTIEREIRTVDGRHILARLLPYRTGEDRIGGAVMNFVDVTTLRAAEADVTIGREQMALIADSMTDFAIVSIAGDGRISGWSAGARQVFGYEPAEALGQPFDMLFTPEDRARGVPADELRLADEEGRAPDERWMLRRDGTPFFASGVLAALKSVGQQGYAKICRDRTDMATVQELADRQLASAREGAAEALHESELKSEFLAVMSHELKHPLNLINVNAELLLVLPEAQNLPAVLRAARTIRRTVQGQARIIDDLLDMSRTNTGKLTLNRVPLLLVEAIQPCMAWALAEARGKGVRLYAEGFDEPIVIDGDPVRIEQVAWNLLSNAVKFSRQGGSIVVRVSQDGNQALFEVKDSGRGIAPAFLPHIFEMFRQADAATTRGEGGLGIGLALVKSLVEMHGGRVAVESEGRGRGSTFKVWLPLHERTDFAPLGDGGLVVATRPLDGARVLLVDDTADTLETFGYLLEHEGAEVTPANSGVEAIEIAGRSPFDLIISDVGMPGMNGYEMMARLRADPATAKIPAIALTGYGRPEDVRQALDAGFQAHVDKPVDFGRMRSVIASVLSGASIAVKGADEPSRE